MQNANLILSPVLTAPSLPQVSPCHQELLPCPAGAHSPHPLLPTQLPALWPWRTLLLPGVLFPPPFAPVWWPLFLREGLPHPLLGRSTCSSVLPISLVTLLPEVYLCAVAKSVCPRDWPQWPALHGCMSASHGAPHAHGAGAYSTT